MEKQYKHPSSTFDLLHNDNEVKEQLKLSICVDLESETDKCYLCALHVSTEKLHIKYNDI